jgi:hypothetical protein
VMRCASAFVIPVTLDVLYMKLDRPPDPLTNVALGPLLAWLLPAGGAGAAAAVVVVLPPTSLQLPGSLLLSLPLLGCCTASTCRARTVQCVSRELG